VLKVVATIDTPINHHGADRPEVKNSAVLEPARLASRTAGRNEIAIETTTMTQSRVVTCMAFVPGDDLRNSGSSLASRANRAKRFRFVLRCLDMPADSRNHQ
jgi:hypothetical protein